MRKGATWAAVAGGFALMLGFLALLLVAVTVAVADGWQLRESAARNRDSSPRFSPGGGRIAFVRGGRVWVMAADGSDQRPVGGAKRFAWTASGRLLVGGGRLPKDAGSARSRGRLVFVRGHRLWLRDRAGVEVELT